jgi:photosystem II stability/assembly factor-like uncharacterized protein
MKQMEWRSIGPANMSGRIPAMTVYAAEPTTWWAASASGGLLKTVNNGVSFENQFDFEDVISIGDVQVFQGDPNIVWVGTGEANPRNSASWGNGVYKSTDGGESWEHLGLDKTAHTGRIALHPANPDIAYVGALGRLWGHNEERGLYKTTDGGKTWKRVLFVDDKTGVIDVQINHENPDILFAATYERMRDAFDGNDPAVKFGVGAGIYRSIDAGETWERLSEGLPSCKMGRIGLNIYQKDPSQIFAVVETEKIGQWPENSSYAGFSGNNADVGARLTEITEDGPSAKAGLESGDIVVKADGQAILSYDALIEMLRAKPAGETIPVTVVRNGELKDFEIELVLRPELKELAEKEKKLTEGETLSADDYRRGSPFAQSLGGQNANMQDQQGEDGKEHGGIYVSRDGGDSWERINSLNPRPMYYSQIRVDPSDNQNIWVLGTSLYKSTDGGKTFSGDGAGGDVHVDHHSMWIDPSNGKHVILGNDGGIYVTYDGGKTWDHHNHVAIGQFYHVGVSHDRDYSVYGGLQDNGSWGGPNRVGNNPGPVNGDWMSIGGGDGFVCLVDPDDPNQLYFESQNGGIGRRNLATGERGFMRPRAPKGTTYRFNWKTPFALSEHNTEIYYTVGNYVFRSLRKGDRLRSISPEITRTDEGAGSAFSESPLDERVLMAGTTDGNLWVTRDMGASWIDLWNSPEDLAEKKVDKKDSKADENDQGTEDKKVEGIRPAETDDEKMATEKDPTTTSDDPTSPVSEAGEIEADVASEESEAVAEESADDAAAPAVTLDATDGEKDSESKPDSEMVATEEDASDLVKNDLDFADSLIGFWDGKFDSGNMPADRSQFNIILKLNDEQRLVGTYRSEQSDGQILRVTLDKETGDFVADAETSGSNLQFRAKLSGQQLTGEVDINAGSFIVSFTASRTSKKPEEPVAEEKLEGQKLADILPKQMWVSSITASKYVISRFYVTLDGHRSDVYEPYVLVTENYGRTWKRLDAALPKNAGSARVIREDISNPEILYLGVEMGLWTTIDRGNSWTRMNSNLPRVAVHEIAQHPTTGEIIAGTHGRSIWILDVTALRQFSSARMSEAAYLYQPNNVVRWQSEPAAGESGTRRFVGKNPTSSAEIYYSLGSDAAEAKLVITDVAGKQIVELDAEDSAGLHKVRWNLRRESLRGSRRFSPQVPNGTYRIALMIDRSEADSTTVEIESDPDSVVTGEALNEYEMFDALFQSELEEESGEEEKSGEARAKRIE